MNHAFFKGRTGLSAVLIAGGIAFSLALGLMIPLEAAANTPATVSYKADFVESDVHWSSNNHTHDCINTEHSLSAAEGDCDDLASWTDSAYVCGYYCQTVTYTHVPNPPWNSLGGNPPQWSEQDMYCAAGAACSSEPISQWPSEWTMYVTEGCGEGGALGSTLNDNFGNEFKDFCLVQTGYISPNDGVCGVTSQADPVTHICYNFWERSGGTPPPSQSGGDPFDMGSGNMFHEVTDYKGGGAFPLVLRRTYNSALANQAASLSHPDQSMGPGWTSTLMGSHLYINLAPPPMVLCTDDGTGYPSGATNDPYYGKTFACPTAPDGNVQGTVTVWHVDGSEAIFTGTFSMDSYYPAASTETLVPEAGSAGALSWNSSTSTYVYQRPDGYTETYDRLGRVLTVQDPNGLQQTYGYNGYQILTVTDHAGRVMSMAYNSNGQIQTVTVPSQASATSTATATITYSYNSTTGNLMSATYQDNNVSPAYQTTINYEYNDSALPHALTGIKDENGSEYAAWSYNDTSMKAVCSERAPSANLPSTATSCLTDTGGIDKVQITYNSDGSADVTEATGLPRHLTFSNVNGRNLLTSASVHCTDCGDSSHTIGYDPNGDGYIAQVTDFAGNTSTYQHDPSTGLELSRTEGQNPDPSKNVSRTVTTTWCGPQSVNGNGCINPFYAVNTITEPGRVTAYSYYPSGETQTKTVTDPATGQSRVTSYAYYPSGLLETVTDPLGNVTTYTYTNNNSGDPHTTTNALHQTVTIGSYTASGLPLTITDANNVVTQLSYDARGRVASRTVTGDTTSYGHNPDETLHSMAMPVTASGQLQLTYGYDRAHRLTSLSDNLGDTLAYTLDAYGNRTEEDTCAGTSCGPNSAADLRIHMRKYDALNELTDEIGGMGQDSVYSNQDGNGIAQTITDPDSNVTARSLDALNRIYNTVDPEGGNTSFNYDGLNRVQNLTDAKGLNTHYALDAFNEITQLISPDTGTTNYDYSAWVSAATVTKTDARGVVSVYSYDPLYRLKSVSYPSDASRNVSYTYDLGTYGVGRLYQMADASGTTTYGYDAHGNLTQQTATLNGHTFPVGYQYDAADNLTDMTYPSGLHVHYGRDAVYRVSEVDANSSPVVTGVSYEPFGPVTGLTYGNQLNESRSYDLDYRIDTVTVPGVLSLSLLQNNCGTSATSGYDKDNNVLAITDLLNGSNSQCFGYDRMNRLTSASGVYGSEAYAYDTITVRDGYDGDRTQETLNGTATSLTYDTASNKLLDVGTQSYGYDAMGNLLSDGSHSYNYDVSGRLTGHDSISTAYLYNGLGQRVVKNPVDTTAPTVSITSPASGKVSGSVQVSAIADDEFGVASVQFQLDGANLGSALTATPYTITWDTTTAPQGPHTLTAVARDAAGNTTTSAPVNVAIPDTIPPTVSITSPAAGPVSGTVTVTASASDNIGVASVQFQLDGANLGNLITTAPYNLPWDTTTVSLGAHVLTAVATDTSGNASTSASVSVTVVDVAATPPNGNLTTNVNAAGNGTLTAPLTYATQTLTFAMVTAPAHGTVTISNPPTVNNNIATVGFTYTPTQGYVGPDSFTFNTTDGRNVVSNPATESVTVNDVAATATAGSLSTHVSTADSSTLGATLAYSGQTVSFAVVRGPAHGAVNITNAATGAFTYTPTSGYSGEDSFTFNVTSHSAVSNTATESILVGPPAVPGPVTINNNYNWATSTGSFTLAWTAPAHTYQYRVFQRTNGGNWVWVGTFNDRSSGTISWSVSGLSQADYDFRVSACNDAPTPIDCSSSSDSVTGVVMTAAPSPWPLGLTISPGNTSNGQFTLSWTSPAATTQYRVFESANGGKYVWVDTFNDNNYGSISRVEPQGGSLGVGTFKFYVLACNTYGCSQSSAIVTGTVSSKGGGGCPPPPYQCQLVMPDDYVTMREIDPASVIGALSPIGEQERGQTPVAAESRTVSAGHREPAPRRPPGEGPIDRIYMNLEKGQASSGVDA